jgi:hypothetical protein
MPTRAVLCLVGIESRHRGAGVSVLAGATNAVLEAAIPSSTVFEDALPEMRERIVCTNGVDPTISLSPNK